MNPAETCPTELWDMSKSPESKSPEMETLFHPNWKMCDKSHTLAAALTKARRIAMQNGLHSESGRWMTISTALQCGVQIAGVDDICINLSACYTRKDLKALDG